jgi:hypothetical protein
MFDGKTSKYVCIKRNAKVYVGKYVLEWEERNRILRVASTFRRRSRMKLVTVLPEPFRVNNPHFVERAVMAFYADLILLPDDHPDVIAGREYVETVWPPVVK